MMRSSPGDEFIQQEGELALERLSQPSPGQKLDLAKGFQEDPNRPGAARAIPGGSQDLETLKAAAEAKREAPEAAAARAVETRRQEIIQTPSRIVSSDDPLNAQFNLGIPEGESARVKFAADGIGNINASVETRFGASSETTIDFSGFAEKEKIKALTDLSTDINTQKQAAFRVVRLSNRIVEILGDDASPLAIVGAVSRLGNSATEQAKAIASAAGVNFDEGSFDFDAFPETAVKSAQVRSNILALAFTVAQAQNRGRVTEKDIQNALKTIGAGSGSTLQMRAALGEVVNDTLLNIDDFIAINRSNFEGSSVRSPQLLQDDLKLRGVTPLSRMEAGQESPVEELPPGIPPGSKLVNQTKNGLPVYRAPNGDLLVVE